MQLGRLWCAVLGMSPMLATAEIRLPQVLSDHAVLQREKPIHLWGWAKPGSTVTVRFHQQTAKAMTNEAGEWSAWLHPETAGGPYVLRVDGDGAVERTDMLVGDVWFASGQSNMEMPLKGFDSAPLKNSETEIKSANQPRIRLMLVPRAGTIFPQTDVKASWAACTPQTAAEFSAVAYFFGREIAEKEKVPVGLIDSTWGGTPVDAWISMDRYGQDPALQTAFRAWAKFADGQNRREEMLPIEKTKEEEAVAAGRPKPKHPWHPNGTSYLPAGLYNGMVAPFAPYSIRGFLWYQGESNSGPDRYRSYAVLFPAMIADWRAQFGQGDLPFLYAQISSFTSTPQEHWGVIRDAQRRALAVRNTAMAVTMDVGQADNVHPPDKQTVASRMAMAARATVYGETLRYASPQFRQAIAEGTAMRVIFDDADGLAARGTLNQFEVAGADHVFVPAKAHLDGNSVMVSASTVATPLYVRYAWKNAATGDLFNDAGLPLGTFTSEESLEE